MANSRSVTWPNSPAPISSSEITGSADDSVVLIERISTWLVEMLMRSPAVMPAAATRRSLSRMRSNTTIESYSE